MNNQSYRVEARSTMTESHDAQKQGRISPARANQCLCFHYIYRKKNPLDSVKGCIPSLRRALSGNPNEKQMHDAAHS